MRDYEGVPGRPDGVDVDIAGSPTTSDLFDAAPDRVSVCTLPFLDYGGITSFSGRCSTIRASDDPQVILETIGEAGLDRVLVIDGSALRECAWLGDKLAKRLIDGGWSGVIVAGLVRDSAILRTLPIGIRALGTTARRSFGRDGRGERDVPLLLGGVTFQAGIMIHVDADAVIVVDEPKE